MVEMELIEIQISHLGTMNIVVLREKDGEREFPIYIGQNEAKAADDAIFNRRSPRPMTHDLIVNVFEGLDVTLEGVVVDALDSNTFHGKLILRNGKGQHVKVDSRPSDAIVLATKTGAPIFVSEEVLEQIGRPEEF